MLATFLRSFLAKISVTYLIFFLVKNRAHICHRTINQVRRQTFHLKNHLKNVINIWKHSVLLFVANPKYMRKYGMFPDRRVFKNMIFFQKIFFIFWSSQIWLTVGERDKYCKK